MKLILLFLFTTLITGEPEEPGGLQKYYLDHINSADLTAEIIWAFTTYYYNIDDNRKNKFLNSIKNEVIFNALQETDQKSSLTKINNDLNNEEILFLNLLLEKDLGTRKKLFSEFYQINNTQYLIDYNNKAKHGTAINSEDLDFQNFQFFHFLIAFYTNTNPLTDDHFYTSFLKNWSEKPLPDSDKNQKDLILATLVRAADVTNRLGLIQTNYEKLLQIEFLPYSYLKRDLYWFIDFALYSLGEVDKSLHIQRNYTIPISKYLGDQNGLNSIYAAQGGYLYMLGNYQSAREVFLLALENEDQLSDLALTRLYNNLSLVYYKTGEANQYVDTQLRALNLAMKLDNYNHQSRIYRNLHIFHRKNRNWDLAQQYINEAAELAYETDNKNDLVSIYVSQAVFDDQFLNNPLEAYKKLELAESYFSAETEPRLRIRVLGERSKLYNKDQRWEESKDLQNEIISLAAEQSDPSTYLEALVELARIYYHMGRVDETRSLLQEYRIHDITILDFPTLVLAKSLQAKLAVHENRFARADQYFSSATELVLERARNTSELESGYWTVEPEFLQLFEWHADFLISRNRTEEALVLLDKIKTINDASLIENPLIKSTVLSEEDLAAERRLQQDMDRVRKEIFIASGQKRLELQNELERLSARKGVLTESLGVRYEYDIIPVWSIQRNLKSNQIILHFTEIENNFYVSLINRRSVDVRKLHFSDEKISVFEEAISSIINGRADLNLLYQIGNYLNLKELTADVNSIILIPDGYFHQLPIDVIPLEQPESAFGYGSAKFLVKQINVRALNSLHDLSVKNKINSFEYDFTGFGVSDFSSESYQRNLIPLPKASEEILNIASGLNRLGSRNAFINDQATTENFRKVAGKSRILHLATHSEVSDGDPLFSRIHFYADQNEETGQNQTVSEQLFAYELFDLNLQNQLIMLNSCESGGGRVLQGSGIMGISRALRYAGAQSLILNAWSVNDQFAADFAEMFYEHLNRGETKSRALQLTKITFIREKNANPHFWGPYIINGDDRPVVQKKASFQNYLILTFLFLLGAFIIRSDRVKKV